MPAASSNAPSFENEKALTVKPCGSWIFVTSLPVATSQMQIISRLHEANRRLSWEKAIVGALLGWPTNCLTSLIEAVGGGGLVGLPVMGGLMISSDGRPSGKGCDLPRTIRVSSDPLASMV